MASLALGNGRGRSLVVLSAVLQLVARSSLASKVPAMGTVRSPRQKEQVA